MSAPPCCKDKTSLNELCEKCVKDFLTSGMCEASAGDILVTTWPDFVTDTLKCECGADKIGGPGHSDWCPKSKD